MRFGFRVDSSATIGFGHIRRCLALADALSSRGAGCVFVCREAEGDLRGAIAAAGHTLQLLPADPIPREGPGSPTASAAEREVADAEATLKTLSDLGRVDAVVVDHYQLGAVWERAVQAAIPRCIVIDDLASRAHVCDALIDTAPGMGRVLAYDRLVPEAALTLLGPRYALLRAEFSARRRSCRVRTGPVRRILLNFGGTDAWPLYELTLDTIRDVLGGEIEIVIVTARGLPPESVLEQRIRADSHLRHYVNVPAMADLMADADLAIGAGGNSAWERACLGLPSLMIAIADNQRDLVADLAKAGAAIGIDAGTSLDSALRRALADLAADPAKLPRMSENATRLVDGKGAQRLAAILACPALRLREAAPADKAAIWHWRNEAFVREMSANPEPISWGDHGRWFAGVLANPDQDLLIGEAGDNAIGVLRFDVEGKQAKISVYLTPDGRGHGFGPEFLRAGERWLKQERPEVAGISAEILSANAPSIAAFSAARYRRRPDGTYHREILNHAAA